MDDYTYEDYLETWQSLYGDDEFGSTFYYSFGRQVATTVYKLSELEFNTHLEAYRTADSKFDNANTDDDIGGMDRALAEAFPHELVLLI